ncbi:hypothetical protein LTR12_009912 [Friedmanniomyces endolithicus]|nr:hypothetical protein LTR12_009912 [Friedmanniomyces endolithicus]
MPAKLRPRTVARASSKEEELAGFRVRAEEEESSAGEGVEEEVADEDDDDDDDDADDDDDGAVKKKKRKKSSKKSSSKKKTKSILGRKGRRPAAYNGFTKQNILTNFKLLEESMTVPHVLTSKLHSSLTRFLQAKDSLELRRRVDLQIPTEPALFAHPPAPGRNITPLVDTNGNLKVIYAVKNGGAKWCLCLVDNVHPEKNKTGSFHYYRDSPCAYDGFIPAVPKNAPSGQTDPGTYTEAEALLVLPALSALYNRWPCTLPDRRDILIRAFLLDIAMQHVFPTVRIALRGVWASGTILTKWELRCKLPVLIPKDEGSSQLEAKQYHLNVSINHCKSTIIAPTLPTHASSPPHDVPTGLNATGQKRYVNALALTRYIQWKLHNVIGTRIQLEHSIAKLKRPFMAMIETTGPYNGQPFYKISPAINESRTYIVPTAKAAADVVWTAKGNSKGNRNPRLFYIRIDSLAKRHVKATRDAAAVVVGVPGTTILAAWEAMCKAADDTNARLAEGEDATGVDTCDEVQSQQHWRSCDKCEQDSICAALKHHPVWQEDYCETCYDIATARLDDQSRNSLAYYRLQHNHHLETKALKMDKARVAAELTAIMNDMPRAVGLKNAKSVQDEYFPTKTRAAEANFIRVPGSLRSTRDPFTVSPDAIFQRHFRIAEDGVTLETALHCPGNIAFTAQYFNYMKHVWPPGMLQRIRDYHVASKQCKTHGELEATWNDIRKLCDIAKKTEYAKTSRLGQEVTLEQVNYYRQQLVTGVSASYQDGAREITAIDILGITLVPPTVDWKPEGLDRFMEVVRQIVKKFRYTGIVMERSSMDGCPWPFHCAGIPTDWSWWTAWCLFGNRVYRMWIWCNGRWVQSDSIETLFLEAIWQYLEGNPRWLRLPLMATLRDPFRFAVAHAHHGRQLRSRWLQWEPTSIDDRDDSLLNMSFETAVENYAKNNYNEELYDEMVADFETLRVGSHLWNPADAGAQPADASFDPTNDMSEERASNDQLLARGEEMDEVETDDQGEVEVEGGKTEAEKVVEEEEGEE